VPAVVVPVVVVAVVPGFWPVAEPAVVPVPVVLVPAIPSENGLLAWLPGCRTTTSEGVWPGVIDMPCGAR
jgi:hypothetical protein